MDKTVKGDSTTNAYRQKYFEKGTLVSWASYSPEGEFEQVRTVADTPANIEQHQTLARE